MKSKITKNPSLAIAALFLAFLIWFVINNFTNPVMTRTIRNVPVTTLNASYLESMGLSYRISDVYNTTDVTVRGNRSDMEGLDVSAIMVTADMRQIIDMASDPVMVPLSASVSGVRYESISLNPQNIPLQLEEMKSKDFVITPSEGGTLPANGYEVAKLTIAPEKITIRGPVSMIDIIDRVTAYVDVSGITVDRNMIPTIRIYDRNGNEFTEQQLSYLSYNVNVEEISVHVTLFEVKSGVSIALTLAGVPAQGYRIGTVTVTPDTVSVVGEQEALAALEDAGNKITIDADRKAVDATGAFEDFETRVDLVDYLPAGIMLTQDTSPTVVVNVQVLPYNSISVTYDTKNINPTGLGKDMDCVFTQSQIELKVQGEDALLAALSAEAIGIRLDLSGEDEGKLEVPLEVSLPDGLSLVEPVRAEITLTRTQKAEGDPTASPTPTEAG